MGRSKSVPSRRHEAGTRTVVGAAALASSPPSSVASPSPLSRRRPSDSPSRDRDRRHASSSSSVEEQQPPPGSTMAAAAAGQTRIHVPPTSLVRSRSGDWAVAASSSASAIVTPEKLQSDQGKKKSAQSRSSDRPRLRRVAFADSEPSVLESQRDSKGGGADDDDDVVVFDEPGQRGSGLGRRIIIDDDEDHKEDSIEKGSASATTDNVRRRICFDDEDGEEDDEEQEEENDADMCDDSAEVRIVREKNQTLVHIASPATRSTSKDIQSHELLRLRLSQIKVDFSAIDAGGSDGGGLGSVRCTIALSSAKAVESLIELWASQSKLADCTTASCDDESLDVAAICRAFENNLFEILFDIYPSASVADVSIRLSNTCFDMCCASQLGVPPIPVPRKMPGNSGQYSKPHPSYTLLVALGTMFKGTVLQDIAASLGAQKAKVGNNNIITAKMVYSSVDNAHAADFEAVPTVRMNIPGLVPTLRPYQEAAVRWMLKREGKGGDAKNACTEWELSWIVMESPSFSANFGAEKSIRSDIISLAEWRQSKKITSVDSQGVTFCNTFTGWTASTYEEARRMTVGNDGDMLGPGVSGGILAESMGLGKSVECIACILANPCPSEVYESSLPKPIGPENDGGDPDTSDDGNGITHNSAPVREETLVPVQDEKRQRIHGAKYQQKKQRATKPLALHDAVCICGRSSNYKESLSWVVCELCGEALHGSCAGFDSEEVLLASTKVGGRARTCTSNHCPSCVASQGSIVKSRATLIVTPPAILAQWQSEIERHSLDPQTGRPLKVVVYPGMRELCSIESSKPHAQLHLVHPGILADADIVLMSFQALLGDLSHSDDNPFAGMGSKPGTGSRLRSRKRYRVVPSPLSSIHFWRICLDEAQRVETPTAASARMARKLVATHRWCVSGTPIGRGKLDDLFGLILFLQMPRPFDDLKWFSNSFVLSQGDALKRLSHLLENVLWRSTKDNDVVRRQMGIPDQEERKVTLRFSSVEKFFYERQLQATMDVAQRVMESESSDTNASGGSGVTDRSAGARVRRTNARDLDSLNSLLQRLRAACCHPQVGASGMSLRRQGRGHHDEGGSVADRVLSMDEILDKLIDDAKGKCEEAQRITVLYTNGLASLMRLKAEAMGDGRGELMGDSTNDSVSRLWEKSLAHYQEVLDMADANATPTEAIGAAELHGSTGFCSNRMIIRDGAASLGWKVRRESTTSNAATRDWSFDQAWCSFTFGGAAKAINCVSIRPITSIPKDVVGNASADGWALLMPKECILQMSSAAVGGEFVDIHRFTLSNEESDDSWREISGFFSSSRSKIWRLVVTSYYSPVGGSPQDFYFTGIDTQLFEPEIAKDNLQRLHTLTNAAIVHSSLMQENTSGGGGNDDAVGTISITTSTREKVRSMEDEAEALSADYMAHARAVHERSHAKLRFAMESRKASEIDLDSVSNGSTQAWYQDLLAWCATQGNESDQRALCDMVQQALSNYYDNRNARSEAAKLEHSLIRRGRLAEFTSVDGLNVALAMRIQQGEADLNLTRDEDRSKCITAVSNLSSRPADREVFENSHCQRCREDWHQKGPVCGHCHLEDTLVKFMKLTNDPELDCVCQSIHNFVQRRLTSTKKGAPAADQEIQYLNSLHQRALRFFDLQEKLRNEIVCSKIKWKSHFDLMSDIDELQQCKQSSRLLSGDDNIAELTEQETAFIIDPNNITTEVAESELKQASAQRELRIHKDSLRYLKNQRAERKATADNNSSGEEQHNSAAASPSTSDSCTVCLSDLQGERSVLRCGHCFHQECLERLVSRAGGGNIVRCPMRCRVTTRTEDVFLATDRRRDDGSQQRRQVKGQYGVKVDRLVGDVLDMIDAGERGIVFSQWEDMLDIIATALSKNDVSYVRPRSGRRFGDDIKRYKSSDCPVLLMNVKNGAEGLTIIEANHVYMVEPMLNCGLDMQAISRIHRIGQKQKTFVHRYVVADTVEVNIDGIRMERQANHFEDDILLQQKHGIKGGGIDGGFDVSELHQLFG